MDKKEYIKLQDEMWDIIEESLPPVDFIVDNDNPRDFMEYLRNAYIKSLAGIL